MAQTNVRNAVLLFKVLNRLLTEGLQVTVEALLLYETFIFKPGRSILYANTNLWSDTADCDTLKAYFTQFS
jgi:hypothetical protein